MPVNELLTMELSDKPRPVIVLIVKVTMQHTSSTGNSTLKNLLVSKHDGSKNTAQ